MTIDNKDIMNVIVEYGHLTYLQGRAQVKGHVPEYQYFDRTAQQQLDLIKGELERPDNYMSSENKKDELKDELKSAVVEFGITAGDSVEALYQDRPDHEVIHGRSTRLLDQILKMIEEM